MSIFYHSIMGLVGYMESRPSTHSFCLRLPLLPEPSKNSPHYPCTLLKISVNQWFGGYRHRRHRDNHNHYRRDNHNHYRRDTPDNHVHY